jgi:hypothetical protein
MYLCVGSSILTISTIFLLDSETVPTVGIVIFTYKYNNIFHGGGGSQSHTIYGKIKVC